MSGGQAARQQNSLRSDADCSLPVTRGLERLRAIADRSGHAIAESHAAFMKQALLPLPSRFH
jgi:hypothetical protein